MSIGPSTSPAMSRMKMAAARVQTRIRRHRPRKVYAAMVSAAYPFVTFLLAVLAPLGVGGAEGAPRGTPTRPATASSAPAANVPLAATTTVATKKINGRDYVSAADIAARLGLKIAWVERGRRLTLTGGSGRAELE